MKAKRGKPGKIKLPQIKKDIKDFILNEEGKISQKNIVKLGISLAILGVSLRPENVQAGHASHDSHSNAFFSTGRGGHNSASIHTAGHDNHSAGGWC